MDKAANGVMLRTSDEGAAEQQSARRVCILVLGMHRSGTSAFARVASLLGCDLPSDLMAASDGNDLGHWESNAVVTLNDQLLASAGSRWDDWLPLNEAWSRSPLRANFLEQAVQIIRDEYGTSPMFVVKDPRICRMAPFWFEAIRAAGADLVIAMPIRNPLEVAESLGSRDGSQRGFALLLWLRHVLEAEASSRGLPRYVFSYDDLLRDWSEVGTKMEEQTGLVWPRQTVLTAAEIDLFLTRDARHQRADDRVALGGRTPLWIRETYAILRKWCEQGEDPADHAKLDAIRDALDHAAPTFAQLILQGTGAGEGVGEAERQRKHLQAEVARLTAALADVREVSDAHLEQRAEALSEALDTATKTLAVKDEELERLLSQAGMLNARIAEVSDALRRQEEAAAAAEAALAIDREVLAGNEQEMARLRAALEAAEQASPRADELEALRARAAQLESDLENAQAALQNALLAAQQRIEEAQSVREAALQSDLDRASNELERSRQAASGMESTIDALHIRVSELEALRDELGSALRQREEEATQAWAELAAEKIAVELLRAELDRRDVDRAAQEQKITRLEERAARQADAFLQSEARLLEARWEAREASARAAVIGEALQQREAEYNDMFVEHRDATARIGRYEREIGTLVQMQYQLEERLAAANAQLAQAGESTGAGAASQVEAALLQIQAQLEVFGQASKPAVTETPAPAHTMKMAEYRAEIVDLTRMLAEQSERSGAFEKRADWLRQVVHTESRAPRWWAILPTAHRKRLLRQRLEKRGLFNYASYYQHNPDVAEAGIDALDHFVRHGIFEGRVW